jgi:hypothetical protein
MRLTRSALAVVAVLALLSPSCGSKTRTVKVRGKVFDPRRSLAFNEQTGKLLVTFRKVTDNPAEAVDTRQARVFPDDDAPGRYRFEIDVEPGKYRISVTHYEQFDLTPDGASKKETYKGMFGDKSRIVRDIQESTDDLTIDLSRPEG